MARGTGPATVTLYIENFLQYTVENFDHNEASDLLLVLIKKIKGAEVYIQPIMEIRFSEREKLNLPAVFYFIEKY